MEQDCHGINVRLGLRTPHTTIGLIGFSVYNIIKASSLKYRYGSFIISEQERGAINYLAHEYSVMAEHVGWVIQESRDILFHR